VPYEVLALAQWVALPKKGRGSRTTILPLPAMTAIASPQAVTFEHWDVLLSVSGVENVSPGATQSLGRLPTPSRKPEEEMFPSGRSEEEGDAWAAAGLSWRTDSSGPSRASV